MRESRTAGFDGTQITYRTYGTGDRWLVIANGYGATFGAWDAVIEHLKTDFKVLIWDYRGLFSSGVPKDTRRIEIEHHVQDLQALLAIEGIDRFVMVGWSVGVQVALETWRQLRGRVEALVLVNGAHDRVLARLLGRIHTRSWAPGVLAVMGHASRVTVPVLRPALRRVGRSRFIIPTFSRLGIVHGTPAGFAGAVQSIIEINVPVYMRMARRANAHQTEGWLPSIDVPTLVTAGTNDVLTPPHISERAAARIPGAEFVSFPGGTHYAVMEFPGMLAGRIREFVERRTRADL